MNEREQRAEDKVLKERYEDGYRDGREHALLYAAMGGDSGVRWREDDGDGFCVAYWAGVRLAAYGLKGGKWYSVAYEDGAPLMVKQWNEEAARTHAGHVAEALVPVIAQKRKQRKVDARVGAHIKCGWREYRALDHAIYFASQCDNYPDEWVSEAAMARGSLGVAIKEKRGPIPQWLKDEWDKGVDEKMGESSEGERESDRGLVVFGGRKPEVIR